MRYEVFVNKVKVAEGDDAQSPLVKLGNQHGQHGDSITVARGYFTLTFTKGVHFVSDAQVQ